MGLEPAHHFCKACPKTLHLSGAPQSVFGVSASRFALDSLFSLPSLTLTLSLSLILSPLPRNVPCWHSGARSHAPGNYIHNNVIISQAMYICQTEFHHVLASAGSWPCQVSLCVDNLCWAPATNCLAFQLLPHA